MSAVRSISCVLDLSSALVCQISTESISIHRKGIIRAMVSTLVAMASNLIAMASNLIAMASTQ